MKSKLKKNKTKMLKIAHRRTGTKRNPIRGSKVMEKSKHAPKAKSKKKKKKKTWKEFSRERMGPYMKKYGGHGPAIRQISKEWKVYKNSI